MSPARGLIAIALPALLVACVGAANPGREASARACEATFPHVRCDNMIDYAATQLGIGRDQIVGIAVLPPPTPEIRDGTSILQTWSGGPPVDTLVTLRDGSVHQVSMHCGGIPDLQCRNDPRLEARSITQGGYFDTPGGATPVPGPDPTAVAAAEPLLVPRLDIPIDHDGHYEVRVGEGTLPNGILTMADFGFVSAAWPTAFTIRGGVVDIQVRSLDDPTRPFQNIHDHGRVEGTERVEGVLVFDVLRHEAGAVLSLRDIVVR